MATNIICLDTNIKNALQLLNDLFVNLTLFVVNLEGVMVGTLTDGDIRRGFLKGVGLDDSVVFVMNKSFRSIKLDHIESGILQELRNEGIFLIPVLDNDGKIIKILDLNKMKGYVPVDVLIMAGGEGTRLRPLTLEIPKPLLKVGGKPIIEYNLDRLQAYGVDRFHISVKYMAEKICDYIGDGKAQNVQIQYIHENTPMGTIGALRLVPEFHHDVVLIMNSDLLTNIDFEGFYSFFKSSNADMAVASSEYAVNIPYAVFQLECDRIKSIKEKPTYTYYSNAGIYLIKKEVIQFVPENTFFNTTDLMESLLQKGLKLVNYPILGYWLDIGSHNEFEKAQEDIKYIQF